MPIRIRVLRVRRARTQHQHQSVAQTLRRRSSRAIGLCTTYVTTVYLRELANALDDIATENGYELVQVLTRQEPARELQRVKNLMSRQVDGLILLPSLSPQASLDAIIQSRTPAVVVDRLCEDNRFHYVIIDNRQAMRRVLAPLLSRGHRRLLFVAQTSMSSPQGTGSPGWKTKRAKPAELSDMKRSNAARTSRPISNGCGRSWSDRKRRQQSSPATAAWLSRQSRRSRRSDLYGRRISPW